MTETVTEVHNDTAPYFPMERDMRCPFAPPEGTRVLREQNPVSRVEIWDGTEPWLITGLAELKSLLKDPRISVDESKEGFPHWNEGMKANVAMRPKSVFNSDGKQHSHFRRMMTKAFTPQTCQRAATVPAGDHRQADHGHAVRPEARGSC